jgi:nicotinate-nucleotide pyrophosphorylase (carboxylating)
MDFYSSQSLAFIQSSLEEDIGSGDHSSLASIPIGTEGKARLLIKEEGVLAGVELAKAILHFVDDQLEVEQLLDDGASVSPGDEGFYVSGSTHSILKSERLLLNCMQRLSGIATYTRQLADIIDGTHAKLLDTRKTTPGLRFLEKWAVTVGGGYNHRHGLYDMVMLKDNHIDYAGGITKAVTRTVDYLKSNDLNIPIEVETRNLEEVSEALSCEGVDRIMFDNFTPELMVEAVTMVKQQCETEASGGITEDTIRSYAETGVDFISVGALTHSVKSLDISLKQVSS